jgi:hypothetical protein
MDLKTAVGQEVQVQLKNRILFSGAKDGWIGPLPSAPPEEGKPSPPPQTTEILQGKLEEASETHAMISYPNPINPRETMFVYVELSNVAAVWRHSSLVMPTQSETNATS